MKKMGGRESVADEVARVRGLASQLQILLRHNSSREAGELSEELLQSLTAALSVLNPDNDNLFSFERPAAAMLNSNDKLFSFERPPTVMLNSNDRLFSFERPAAAMLNSNDKLFPFERPPTAMLNSNDRLFSFQRPAATMLNSSSSSYTMKRENKERNCLGSQLQSSRNPISSRNSCSRRIELTSSPYYDGHEWRKYGQKDIKGTVFPRCYYKCTYADEHECPATKQVEQKNWNDPPTFEVRYYKQHNCKSKFILPKLAMDEGILNTTPDQLSSSAYSIPTRMYESTSNEHGHTGYPDLSCAVSPDPEEQQALDRCAVSPDPEEQQALDHDTELLRALLLPNPDFSLACL